MDGYKIIDAAQLDANLGHLADSIRAKAGVTDKLAFPDGMISAVDGIQTDGGGTLPTAQAKDINFYDYDGTRLYSYTVEEAAALTELPPLPSHDGLICQGWNWNLDDIKTMGRAVNVGAMYITDDGKTRVYITLHEGRTSPMLGCCPNGTVTVDWGDGTEPDVLTGTSVWTVKWTPTHEYAAPGDYVITLTVDGTMVFYGNETNNQHSAILRHSSAADTRNIAYQNAVQKVEVGSGITSIGTYAFRGCYSLKSVTIPNSVTSIETYAFSNCRSLKSFTIPNSVTSIENSTLSYCYSLTSVTIPDGVKSIGREAFRDVHNLTSVTIPDGVKSIGTYAFDSCYSLKSVTIPNSVTSIETYAFSNCHGFTGITIPNSVKSIDSYAFRDCYSLKSFTIPNSVTSIGDGVFSYCRSLKSFTIPNSVTSIRTGMFKDCHSLTSVTIPDSVTSIENTMFSNCHSLTSVTIPDSVTSIGTYAFQNCYGMRFCDFKNHTYVPTLYSTNAFDKIPADCEIRVPAALVDEWKAATNWSTYADYIVGV